MSSSHFTGEQSESEEGEHYARGHPAKKCGVKLLNWVFLTSKALGSTHSHMKFTHEFHSAKWKVKAYVF